MSATVRERPAAKEQPPAATAGADLLTPQQEELLLLYSPTLARSYVRWKAAASNPMPRTLALGLRQWQELGCPAQRPADAAASAAALSPELFSSLAEEGGQADPMFVLASPQTEQEPGPESEQELLRPDPRLAPGRGRRKKSPPASASSPLAEAFNTSASAGSPPGAGPHSTPSTTPDAGRTEATATQNKDAEAVRASAPRPAASQGALPGIVVPRTPGETAPMSNYLARTSLFAPIRKGRRVMHDKQKLHSPEGLDVLYSGKQLDMADQDVYLTALRLAAGIKPGDRIVINRAAFLRMLGYKHNPGARDYKWLEESFYRISTGRVIIEARNMKANLPLIGALLMDEISGDYYFTIPRETYALWAKNLYGYIDLEKRHALERNVPLSKWLQSYAQSHAPGQHTISMDLLHTWCGYGGRLRDFRDSLIGALEELARVGILKAWSIQVRGLGRQKKNMITWIRERTHRDDTDCIAEGTW